jgi:hypothetical protein
MWEPVSAVALSIFLTVSLFFAVFVAAYLICRGFFFTWKMIKKAWEATKKESE